MIEGDKYLLALNCWVTMADGKDYRSIHGKYNGVEELAGVKFVLIDNTMIDAKTINSIQKSDVCTLGMVMHDEWGSGGHVKYKRPSSTFNASLKSSYEKITSG